MRYTEDDERCSSGMDFLSDHTLMKSFPFLQIPSVFLCIFENYISYFSTKTYVVGSQKNHLHEMVLLNTQNICLNWLETNDNVL